jgi:hypothetical protein
MGTSYHKHFTRILRRLIREGKALLENSHILGLYVIKEKGYPTLVAQVTDPSITFITGESGREITEFVRRSS